MHQDNPTCFHRAVEVASTPANEVINDTHLGNACFQQLIDRSASNEACAASN
jgi:hypothetical protein